MKKFKLIKKYPGSPNLGTTCEERNNKSSFCYYFEGEKNIGITKDQVENQPEYWEEVIEKDYEILKTCPIEGRIYSVKRLSDGEVFTVGDKITGYSYEDARSIQTIKICTYTGIIKLEQEKGFTSLCTATKVVEKDYEILRYHSIENPSIGRTTCNSKLNDTYNIYSVKRLSDGEVFTVGDRAKVYEYGSIKTIDSMTLVTKCSSMKEGIWLNYNSGSSHITHAIKQEKQPIFLTHDGKDIFTEDIVWYVNKENLYYDYIIAQPEVKFNSEIRAYFLTREAAEDYIERNKPRLSIEDCSQILLKWFLYGEGFEESIKEYIRKNNK